MFLSEVPTEWTLEAEVERGGVSHVFAGEDLVYDARQNAVGFVEYWPEPGSEIAVIYERIDRAGD